MGSSPAAPILDHGTGNEESTPMRARIYQTPKSAMQSGRARSHVWMLVYTAEQKRTPDALMGWIGGAETQTQVRLRFPTRDAAIAYADANGIDYEVETAHGRKVRPKQYSDNFKFGRIYNWTH
ncbi:ETC complex I subunit [Granulibacter bethesdensis]|uniref:ETC complex I subunit n=2 Tax=Granulibacter bethesdensis TaxID=364410 RepID=UPI000F7A7960|nr:ETC complex I subunit [Granulibacter bethesdensis]